MDEWLASVRTRYAIYYTRLGVGPGDPLPIITAASFRLCKQQPNCRAWYDEACYILRHVFPKKGGLPTLANLDPEQRRGALIAFNRTAHKLLATNIAEARAAQNNKPMPRQQLTPQVCNIHRLWKFFGPLVSRRRKTDCGEAIVAKHRHVIRVPMGLRQAAVYQFHLQAEYRDKNDRPAIGAKLQALRIAAANPASTLLQAPGPRPVPGRSASTPSLHHSNTPVPSGSPRSDYNYIPKLAAVLKLLDQFLRRGEQTIVFSAFHDSLDALATRLTEAGINHVLLDRRMTQARRGKLAAQFKRGWSPTPSLHHSITPSLHFPVALASV